MGPLHKADTVDHKGSVYELNMQVDFTNLPPDKSKNQYKLRSDLSVQPEPVKEVPEPVKETPAPEPAPAPTPVPEPVVVETKPDAATVVAELKKWIGFAQDLVLELQPRPTPNPAPTPMPAPTPEPTPTPVPTPVPQPTKPDVVVKPTPTPVPSGYGFEEADKAKGRVDRSKMKVVAVGNAMELRNHLAADLSNTLLKLQRGDYLGKFEQTGAWNNVELTSENQDARLLNLVGTTALIMQGSKIRERVAYTGFKAQSDANSGGYPLFWWNELGLYAGLEIAELDLSCPNAANAMGCVQYSTSSKQGRVAQDVWIHGNNIHDVGRCGMEFLSQGYDGVFRLLNLVIEDNRFDNLGLKDQYGMAVSLSGLFRQIGLNNNNATRTRKIAYELVNSQQVIARGNNCDNGTDGVGWGISDDNRGFTQDIYIEGGSIRAAERPFYIYQGNNVNIDGQGQKWKGHRGIQMGQANGCNFKNLDVLIHSKVKEAGWEFTGSVQNSKLTDSTVSSAGATAAGFLPSYESIVLRGGSKGNVLDNVATVMGKLSNGATFAPSPETGGDGRIVDQGANVVTNNKKSVAA